MRRQVCSGGAADAKCLLTIHPSHALQRNATTAPRYVSQGSNPLNTPVVAFLRNALCWRAMQQAFRTASATAAPALHTGLHISYP